MTENADGSAIGNDWAKGFLIGTQMRNDIWDEVFRDGKRNGPLVPILALAHEHHSYPELCSFSEPLDAECRETLSVGAAAGVMRFHAMFQPMRRYFVSATLPPSVACELPVPFPRPDRRCRFEFGVRRRNGRPFGQLEMRRGFTAGGDRGGDWAPSADKGRAGTDCGGELAAGGFVDRCCAATVLACANAAAGTKVNARVRKMRSGTSDTEFCQGRAGKSARLCASTRSRRLSGANTSTPSPHV